MLKKLNTLLLFFSLENIMRVHIGIFAMLLQMQITIFHLL